MKTCKRVQLFELLKMFSCVRLWIALAAFVVCGCESPVAQSSGPSGPQGFTIERVRISALTDFVVSKEDPEKSEIKTFVELLDAYDSELKKPCIFRFELYEYKPMSSDPRGKRLIIWPDMDLTGPLENSRHWKDYLRAYEFYLPLGFSPTAETNYLLEVTCLVGDSRFSGVSKIRFRP
ncbi:MAG: hypothetical protein H8E62_10630 [Planctomycetes bacterium]|nr:hypothetical protein [Planctomycetota bacterium]